MCTCQNPPPREYPFDYRHFSLAMAVWAVEYLHGGEITLQYYELWRGPEITQSSNVPSVPLPRSSIFFAAGRRTRGRGARVFTDAPVASDAVCFGLAGALLRGGF